MSMHNYSKNVREINKAVNSRLHLSGVTPYHVHENGSRSRVYYARTKPIKGTTARQLQVLLDSGKGWTNTDQVDIETI